MLKTKYRDLLKKYFASLGYFADKYYSATSQRERIKILAENIWPIFQSEKLKPILEQLNNDIVKGNKKYNKVLKSLKKELKPALESLKKMLIEKKLFGIFKQRLSKIENLISSEKLDFVLDIFSEIKEIFFNIADLENIKYLEKVELIKPYVDKILRRRDVFVDEKGKEEIIEKPSWYNFTFAPSIQKIDEISKESFETDFQSSFSVLLFFNTLLDYWKMSLQELRENKINSIKKSFINSLLFEEMYFLKSKDQIDPIYFSKKNTDKCLRFILDKVISYQEACFKTPMEEFNGVSLYKLSLRLDEDYLYLLLDIQYDKKSKSEIRILGKLQDSSENYEIAKEVLNSNLSVVKTSERGTTISKFLNQMNLNNFLGKYFLPKKGRTVNAINDRHTTIIINEQMDQKTTDLMTKHINLSVNEKLNLVAEIEKLKLY